MQAGALLRFALVSLAEAETHQHYFIKQYQDIGLTQSHKTTHLLRARITFGDVVCNEYAARHMKYEFCVLGSNCAVLRP